MERDNGKNGQTALSRGSKVTSHPVTYSSPPATLETTPQTLSKGACAEQSMIKTVTKGGEQRQQKARLQSHRTGSLQILQRQRWTKEGCSRVAVKGSTFVFTNPTLFTTNSPRVMMKGGLQPCPSPAIPSFRCLYTPHSPHARQVLRHWLPFSFQHSVPFLGTITPPLLFKSTLVSYIKLHWLLLSSFCHLFYKR